MDPSSSLPEPKPTAPSSRRPPPDCAPPGTSAQDRSSPSKDEAASAGPDRLQAGPGAGGPRVEPGDPARQRTFLRVGGPDDLVAAIPYLVGFQPVRSVVVVSLRGPRLRCGLVARVDVPTRASLRPWADGLVSFVLRDHPREVVVLVHHDRPWRAGRRPFGPAVAELRRRFAEAEVPLKDALYITSERFWSYLCSEPRCCPPEGRSLDAGRSSPIAAAYVAEGRAPLRDRAAVVAQLSPGPPDLLAATRVAAEEAMKVTLGSNRADLHGHWTMWQSGTADLFSALVRRRLDGDTRPPTVGELGRIAAGLLDRTTRDLVALRSTAWARAMPGQGTLDPADPLDALWDDPATDLSELRRLHRACAAPEDPRCLTPDGQEEVAAVLAALCRSCDGYLAVAPLSLAGMQAWACGDGVVAGAAVERALAIDPGCTMAGLLGELLDHGIAPAWVERDRAEDEAVQPRPDG